MNQERFERVDKILQNALLLPAGRRAAFLKEACAGDETVKRSVESLLADCDSGSLMPSDRSAGPSLAALADGFRTDSRSELTAQPLEAEVDRLISTLTPGEVIADQLVYQRVLGQGAFGIVLLCWAINNRKPCALKTPLRARISSAEDLEMFNKEILRWVRLGGHPNIVFAYGLLDFMRLPFVIMEYVPNASMLRDLIQRRETDWRVALSVGYQVAKGLDHAYSVAGLIHRDLKPENILVDTQTLSAKVSDFGISIARKIETDDGHLAGTPQYIAPERWLMTGEDDFRSDIYSLGVIMFESATGRRPFPDRRSVLAYTWDHVKEPPPDVRSYRTEIPGDVAALIARCLAKRPEERHATLQSLAEELFRLHEKVVGKPPQEGEDPDIPTKVDNAINLSVTYGHLGMLDEAIEEARRALEFDNKSHGAWIALGNAYKKEKRYNEAVRAYLNGFGLSPRDIIAVANVALCYSAMGNKREGVAWMVQALARAQDGALLHYLDSLTGWIAEIAEPGQALALLDHVLAKNPRSVAAWNNRAILLRRMGRYSDALASATKALELNPAYPQGWTSRANALIGLRRYQEALESAERALDFDRTMAGAHAAKATSLMNLRRPKEAEAALRQGLRERPEHPVLTEALTEYGFL